MKIFCIGRNYAEHARELGNAVPVGEPLIFMKPPTAIVRGDKPIFYPDFTKDLHHEGEIVLRICKKGRAVQPEFAREFFDAVAFGIDFTARDVQDRLKQKGQPWEIAKGFDGSAPLGPWLNLGDLENPADIRFQLKKNGQIVQDGRTRDLIFPFETLIVAISKYFTLQKGDMVFTGTPAGVGPVAVGDVLEGFIENRAMLRCAVR